MEVTKEQLIQTFKNQEMIFSRSYYALAQNFNTSTLEIMLSELKESINYNFENQIYSGLVKQNLYKILHVYQAKFKDTDILDEINELIEKLNKSGEENVNEFLIQHYFMRYSNGYPKKENKKVMIDPYSKQYFIYNSISNDYDFFKQLLELSNDDFVYRNIFEALPLSNITYLLVNYSNVLKEKELAMKIINLLEANIYAGKHDFVTLNRKGEKVHVMSTLTDVMQCQSKDCLKKIKKLKLDK